jgi:hypothetical protein
LLLTCIINNVYEIFYKDFSFHLILQKTWMQNGQFLVLMVYVSSFTMIPHFILIAKKCLLRSFLLYLQLQVFYNTV